MQVLTSGPLGRETRDKHTMRILTSAPPGRETNKNEPCIISLLALRKQGKNTPCNFSPLALRGGKHHAVAIDNDVEMTARGLAPAGPAAPRSGLLGRPS